MSASPPGDSSEDGAWSGPPASGPASRPATANSSPALHSLVIGDTDALLCVGAAGRHQGVNMMYRRYVRHGSGLLVPRQVRWELEHKARGGGRLQSAATKVTGGRAAPFIKTDDTRWGKAERRDIRERVVAAERAQRGNPKVHGHDGEVEAILLAQRENAILLSNDKAARRAAEEIGVRTATFAMVLAAEVRDGDLLAAEAAEVCLNMPDGIWAGMHNASAATMTALARRITPGL